MESRLKGVVDSKEIADIKAKLEEELGAVFDLTEIKESNEYKEFFNGSE
jgi:hypothetical protein